MRKRLFSSLLLSLLCALLLPNTLVPCATTRLLLAWNFGVVFYLALVLHTVTRSNHESMRHRAIHQAESKYVEFVLVLMAALAAVIAIFVQLTLAKSHTGGVKIFEVTLSIATIFLAWVFIHSMFALHYAHDFYESEARGQAAGVLFPGTKDPGYGDFFYCAFIIGTSGQTADVSFVNKSQRRIALIHSVLSFVFNTTMLAMTINVAAGFL